MQNIDVRFNASSNFTKVKADLASLEAQAASLRTVFESNAYAKPPAVVDPTAWRQSTAAVNSASRAFRDAASSSGLFQTQQIRSISEAERYTKALQKQKLSMKDMIKHRGIMKEVYNDQLRYQRMTAQYWGTDHMGRAITDIAIPNSVPKDLDTMGQRMRFFGDMAKSSGTQVVNLGKNIQWAGRQLTVGFTYPMVLFGAAAGMAAFKVEEAYAKINKVYDVSAKAVNNAALREKELGELRVRSTKMATEVAQQYGLTIDKTLAVEQELAATGLKGQKLIDSTREVQRISALGDIDPTQTADMVVALQTAFKDTIKDGRDLTNTLNFMNATSNATSLSLQDIAEATPRAASGLAQLDVTAEEMTIMLVSMREAGVDAAEGANALKSATTRILNPVKKAKDIYAQYGISLDQLSQKSGGNLFQFLQMLGAEQQKIQGSTEKQTKYLRAQGIAALFGTYQYNRLNAALVNIGDAYAGANNQTRKAIDLQKMSNEEMAKMAKNSEEAMMNNAAGRFKQAWASFHAELAEMGTPFLEAASKVLGVLADLAGAFNGMDDWKKKAIMIGVSIMAIAGPVVMLTGLFMNLFGQFVKGSGTILSVFGRLRGGIALVNKEEKSAILTTEATNRALNGQTRAAATLAQEINVLAAAYEKANIASKNMLQSTVAETTAMTQQARAAATSSVSQMPRNTAVSYSYTRGKNASETAANASVARAAAVEGIVANEKKIVQQAQREQQVRQRIEDNIGGGAIFMSAMAASSAAMMVSSNQTVDNIAKWAMIGTLVVPAVQAANAGVASAGAGISRIIQSIKTATVGMGGLNAAMTAAKVGAVGFGRALNAALGPIGWIALGLTAVVGVFTAINDHQEKIKREQQELFKAQDEANRKFNQSAESLATSLGQAAGHYKDIANRGYTPGGRSTSGNGDELYSRFQYYKEDSEGVKETKGLMSNGQMLSDAQLLDKIEQKFITLQVVGGDTAEQAKTDIQAMLMALGKGSAEALALSDGVYKRLGDISKVNWVGPVKNQIDMLNNISPGMLGGVETQINMSQYGSGISYLTKDIDKNTVKALKTQAKTAAQIFSEALANSSNPKEAQNVINTFMNGALREWNNGFKAIEASTVAGADKVRALFDKYGIQSGKDFSEAWANNADFKKAYEDMTSDMDMNAPFASMMNAITKSGTTWENTIIGQLADVSGELPDDIESVSDALAELRELGYDPNFAKPYKEQKEVLKDMGIIADGTGKSIQDIVQQAQALGVSAESLPGMGTNIEKARIALNQFNHANGFKEGKDYAEALYNFLHRIPAVANSAKGALNGVANGVESIPTRVSIRIDAEGAVGVMRSAMQNVQSAMASSANRSFNATWDAKESGLQRQQDAAMNAFEDRWSARKDAVSAMYERRQAAIERQIKAEEKANDTRQRLFEAEKARLQRLAELQNNNIDFNTAVTEGRLDDAAKIQNDAVASSGASQMDAEQKAAEVKSQARVEFLQKQNEKLEKQRDAQMKRLEKLEERRRRAIQASQEAAMTALKQQRDYEEAMLQQRLELFQSYTGRNKKDLERWMKVVGLSYDDFGSDVKAKGESWSTYFENSLQAHIRQAGTELLNDKMWEGIGKEMANKMLKGMGFNGLADFNHFVKTGEMPKKSEKTPETRHTGGVVGSGGGSRGNIPNTYRGLHRSETMVRAQLGEFVVNANATKNNMGLLHRINNGEDITRPLFNNPVGSPSEGRGGPTGPAGLIAGAIAQMYGKGLQAGMQAGISKKQQSAMAGLFGMAGAGKYGGTMFSAEQLKNANIIANVGSSMGMSQRDIVIGLMTAMQESMLRNVNYGDRDSLGLFQQRPSMGWGTPEQVTNPQYAATKFFQGLKGVKGREGMPLTAAAQAVQRSAFPEAYAKWEDEARAMVAAMSKNGGKLNVSGGGFFGAGGGANSIGKAAIRWAADHIGAYGWAGYCQKFVRMAFGAPGGYASAIDAWYGARMKHAGDRNPPSGVPVYFTPGSNGLGHVALHTGGGRVISTDYPVGGIIGTGTIAGIERDWGRRYLGWTGDINGKTIYPGLKKGGTIRYDNTIANLHRGETVLTAPLTKQFKDNVASGGGDRYDITIDLRGAYIKEEVDLERAVNAAIDKRENKLGRKRIVK